MINRRLSFHGLYLLARARKRNIFARGGLRGAVLVECAMELLLCGLVAYFGYFVNIRPFLPQNNRLYIRHLAYLVL